MNPRRLTVDRMFYSQPPHFMFFKSPIKTPEAAVIRWSEAPLAPFFSEVF